MQLNSVYFFGEIPDDAIESVTIYVIIIRGHSFSSRFVVKPEGGQQCMFDVFLTKPVESQCKLRGSRGTRGGKTPSPHPNPLDISSNVHSDIRQ